MKWVVANRCCIIFWSIIATIITIIFTRPPYIPWYAGKDFKPLPINYTIIDNYIKNQSDPDDPYGITFLLPLERFDRDDNRRKFHIVWNTTRFPLYGGSILNPLHRKVYKTDKRGK